MNNLVTKKQAENLKKLGFNEEVSHYIMLGFTKVITSRPTNWNNEKVPFPIKEFEITTNKPYTSVPTLDEAIDWFERKLKCSIEIYYRDWNHSFYSYTKMYNEYKMKELLVCNTLTKSKNTIKRKIITRMIKYVQESKSTSSKTKKKQTSR